MSERTSAHRIGRIVGFRATYVFDMSQMEAKEFSDYLRANTD